MAAVNSVGQRINGGDHTLLVLVNVLAGVIVCVIVGLAISPFVKKYSDRLIYEGKSMKVVGRSVFLFNGSYDEAFQKTVRSFEKSKFRVYNSDPSRHIITGGIPYTFLNNAYTATARFYSEGNHIAVHLETGPTFHLLDAGKSLRMLKAFETAWNSRV